MAKFEVGAHHGESFRVTVEADSEEEAISKVYKGLEDGGVEHYPDRDVTDREYDAISAKKLK